ncbi:MAG: ABC transporter ATP-binding protein [Lachnospiraceae bacterium]
MECMIETKNLNRIFPVTGGEFHALKDISIRIPKKSLTILKGRSGSGKTTLLNILGALDRPTSGSLLYEGADICDYSEKKRELLRRKEIGFVFQSVSLIPMMNAFENVEFSMRLAGIKEGRKERVEECLKLVGLGSRMNHMPQEMSGGEQQRVAIARALAHRPKVIFADEPTAELDSATAVAVMKLFRDLVEREDVTIVMTTHDVGLMSAGTVSYELEDGALKSAAMQE